MDLCVAGTGYCTVHNVSRVQLEEARKSFFCLISSEGQQPAKCQFKYILEELGRKHRYIQGKFSAVYMEVVPGLKKMCVD